MAVTPLGVRADYEGGSSDTPTDGTVHEPANTRCAHRMQVLRCRELRDRIAVHTTLPRVFCDRSILHLQSCPTELAPKLTARVSCLTLPPLARV